MSRSRCWPGTRRHPASLFEDQELVEGINYLEMRDGTTLAAMVRFPSFPRDDVPADGPYPTVVNMSGYSPADPSSPPPELQLADALGYATVGVNLRGTGCSGGALSFFEGPQVADGYDAIEAIAAQDWVAGNEVGMVGISYPGITQLFVASTQPPHLAAISPMSVIDDPYAGVGYPGGIFNSGFAAEWTSHVSDDAAAYGPDYVNQQIDEGDTDCDGNQALRSQNLDLVAGLEAEPYDDADRFGPIRPAELVDRIDVPVFLTGQWQDEQTSGHFADMLDRFTGTDRLHAYLTNGPHGDGLTLPNFQRWADFLDLYVAHRIPDAARRRPGRGAAGDQRHLRRGRGPRARPLRRLRLLRGGPGRLGGRRPLHGGVRERGGHRPPRRAGRDDGGHVRLLAAPRGRGHHLVLRAGRDPRPRRAHGGRR